MHLYTRQIIHTIKYFCISVNFCISWQVTVNRCTNSTAAHKLRTFVPRGWLHTGHGSGFSPESKLSRACSQYTQQLRLKDSTYIKIYTVIITLSTQQTKVNNHKHSVLHIADATCTAFQQMHVYKPHGA